MLAIFAFVLATIVAPGPQQSSGLLVIEAPEHQIQNGAQVTIDIENGFIESDGQQYRATKMPDVMLKILNAGGLVNFLNQAGGYQ